MKPEAAAKVVLGEGGPGLEIYRDALASFSEHMPPYRYHFLTHSKPATHIQALAHLDDAAIQKALPETYRALLKNVGDNVRPY